MSLPPLGEKIFSMTPASLSHKATPLARENNTRMANGCTPESKRAMQLLSGETQKYFAALMMLVENMDAEGNTARALKPMLEEQLIRLNEKLALIATILETDSSEILRYVK